MAKKALPAALQKFQFKKGGGRVGAKPASKPKGK
jgi:hypothetical protein